ncbi:MAG TPA: FAD-dependent monooxygenase [Candidatus Limnocylindria bacterium]|nr:FAD-dependent monooxygenase [Candidatus Limnocylindria bacterium]
MSAAEVVVVGGGPGGATVATLLARRGRQVVLLERSPAWRWRACGVFSSPAAVTALRRAGVDEGVLRSATRPVTAMRVEADDGTAFRLTYGGDGSLDRSAVGFDREALDTALLDMARGAGVAVRSGVTLTGAVLGRGRQRLAIRDGNGMDEVETRLLVGADGVRSTVARLAGAVRPARLGPRIGLTFHVVDPRPEDIRDARMVLADHAYCGLAPVPGGRVNVGIVLGGPTWQRRLAADGAARVVTAVLAAIPRAPDDEVDWASAERCDTIEGAAPLGHRVARRSGEGWLLVGDAAGFLDPLTGEGLHRALVSAALAAAAVDAHLDGRPGALDDYEGAMTRRFRAKDLVTLLVQGFAARPVLFRHVARRLAHRADLRETMGLVMGDLLPATRALEPAFLAALLR